MENEESVTVELTSSDVTMTLEQARGVASELQALVDERGPDLVPALRGPVGEPAIRADGHLRIGPWLLQGEMDRAVLVHREPGAGYRYVAVLGTRDGEWIVDSLQAERIRPGPER